MDRTKPMERLTSVAARVPVGRPMVDDASKAAKLQFGAEMEHFAAAYRHELVPETIRVYWLALKDIPLEIRTSGLTVCLKKHKFFPTVAEILTACADVVDERRKELARQAQSHQSTCPDCQHSPGWRETETGAVVRCNCHKRAVALMAQAEAPISRPALPASTETVGES